MMIYFLGILILAFFATGVILFMQTTPKIKHQTVAQEKTEEDSIPERIETPEEKQSRLDKMKSDIVDLPFSNIGVNEESSYMLERFGLAEPEKNLHDDVD